jgi:hypothetical protein
MCIHKFDLCLLLNVAWLSAGFCSGFRLLLFFDYLELDTIISNSVASWWLTSSLHEETFFCQCSALRKSSY